MCGINGFNWQDENLIKRMNTKIVHRGPDGEGVFLAPEISLGHRRLAIIDLSPRASQPMTDYGGRFTIVYNGEIYNFKEIKGELSNEFNFKSDSDTEVLLCAYKKWGKEFLSRLNGIFAFAIWDNEKKELFLARDRIGVKPLYYFYDGKKFIFSSEIKAILEHNIPRELDMDAFNLYFRVLYVPGPLTMFKNIKKLLPGRCLTLKDGRLDSSQYWEIKDWTDFSSYGEALEKIKFLIEDSIRGQLISDRPVGVFLSGGMDSTAILGIVNKIKGKGIKTYSVGFNVKEDGEKFNADLNLARKTAQYYGADHHELTTSGADILKYFDTVAYHMDEPVSNAVQIATYLLAQEAKKDVAVVLGGDGGDEIFGGYPRYYFNYLIDIYQKMPKALGRAYFSQLAGLIFKNKGVAKKLELAGVSRWMEFMIQKEASVKNIINTEIGDNLANKNFYEKRFFKNIPTNDFTKYFMAVDTVNWMTDESLLRTDKMTMAHGLEERVPILDHRLVEAAMKIPTRWKINNAKQGKAIWRKAILEYLPPFVANHPKHGFFSPGAKWLRYELKDFATETFNSLDPALFNVDGAKKMLYNHIEKRNYNLNLIWSVLTWQVWYNRFIK